MKKSELKKLIREEAKRIIALQSQIVKESLAITEIGDVPENEPLDADTGRSYAVRKKRQSSEYPDAPDTEYEFIVDNPDSSSGRPLYYVIELSAFKPRSEREDIELDVSFKADGSYTKVTNANQQFKVMATVVKVIKDYLKAHPKITKVTFRPVKDTSRKNDTRREQLYLAYVKKQIPNANVTVQSGFAFPKYIIDLPKKVSERKINEIGDSAATTYEWTNPSKGIYRFKSDSGLEYRIELEEHSHPSIGHGSVLEISYRLLGDMYNMVTNKGEQFRVMATLIETIKDYLKDNPQVNRISFVPVKSFDRENDNRRANLYMAYVKKQLPGANVKIDGNRFTIDLN